jgi:hypothetical protein
VPCARALLRYWYFEVDAALSVLCERTTIMLLMSDGRAFTAASATAY